MYVLCGTWYDSVEALMAVYPATPIHASVDRNISISSVWDNGKILPQDAAACFCDSRTECQYTQLTRDVNNSEFGKQLSLTNAHIAWSGALALRSTRDITEGEEILATRGHAFWKARGFPSSRSSQSSPVVQEVQGFREMQSAKT